ncbi:MAG: MBL fold metallo-hydrolase [Akkermansia sp.]
MISFTNISGAEEIGSNCYVLDLDGTKVVLDSGMHPKREGVAAMPEFGAIAGESIDALFVTHSHLDHLGTVPVFQDKHPEAEVFMTPATVSLAEVMLHNSVNVMSSKRVELGIVEYPFFTHPELDHLCECWQGKPCNESFRIGANKEVLATLFDAGHILGSAGVLMESQHGESVFYTGDVQFEDQSMIPGADFPQKGVDTLIMECTRGGFSRSQHYNRPDELKRFAKSIADTLARGGIVLIPVFALGKSQEMLYNIHQFKKEGLIPKETPVYFGGLGAKVTKLYDIFANKTRRFDPKFKIKEEVKVVSLPRKGKTPLRCEPGNIYLISSGMMTEKTVSNVVAEQVLPNEKNAILFVGYCDPDSPAGALRATPHGELIKMRPNGQPVRRICPIESFDFSGHSPRENLVEYAVSLKPKRIILIHGDPDAVEWMADELNDRLPKTQVIAPVAGKTYHFS